ncbi:hypothetical protein TIFTF001_034341 [Ficus carica]|uniref:Uncharacterized protein n=1 Tax=Ficus carica TaxID=3494 RepID=A0AA88E2L3_FICCA|nr:hypothetical protein TIFTF001_034341 [Ficus carica]
MQLDANAYRILISCFVLWAKYYCAELLFRVFQNLYRMKKTPSLTGSYYFQGYQGTFIVGCPDSDKNYKYLLFHAAGRWLSGRLDYAQVPSGERVPLTFRRGYVWTQGPHAETINLERIEKLQEKADPERNQN